MKPSRLLHHLQRPELTVDIPHSPTPISLVHSPCDAMDSTCQSPYHTPVAPHSPMSSISSAESYQTAQESPTTPASIESPTSLSSMSTDSQLIAAMHEWGDSPPSSLKAAINEAVDDTTAFSTVNALRERQQFGGIDVVKASRQRFDAAYTYVPSDGFWRCCIDGSRQSSPWEFDRDEPGYLSGMIQGYLLCRESICQPVDATRLETIHYLACNGVLTKSSSPASICKLSFRHQTGNYFKFTMNSNATISGIEELNHEIHSGRLMGFSHLPDENRLLCTVPRDRSEIRLKVEEVLAQHSIQINAIKSSHSEMTAERSNAIVRVIIDTCQLLDRVHPFIDGNIRTIGVLLMNLYLVQEGESPTILNDPNILDGWSIDEIFESLRQGQTTFRLLCAQLSIETSNECSSYDDWARYLQGNGPIPNTDEATKPAFMTMILRMIEEAPALLAPRVLAESFAIVCTTRDHVGVKSLLPHLDSRYVAYEALLSQSIALGTVAITHSLASHKDLCEEAWSRCIMQSIQHGCIDTILAMLNKEHGHYCQRWITAVAGSLAKPSICQNTVDAIIEHRFGNLPSGIDSAMAWAVSAGHIDLAEHLSRHLARSGNVLQAVK